MKQIEGLNFQVIGPTYLDRLGVWAEFGLAKIKLMPYAGMA